MFLKTVYLWREKKTFILRKLFIFLLLFFTHTHNIITKYYLFMIIIFYGKKNTVCLNLTEKMCNHKRVTF